MGDKINFFQKLKNEENSGLEITMFSISVVVAVFVLACIVTLGVLLHKANANRITDEEANANNVTGASVTVTEQPTASPETNAIVAGNEEDFGTDDVDNELKNADSAYTTASVNLRSEPSLTASVVTKVPAATKVKVSGLDDSNKWMKVDYNGSTGYINVMYLTTTKPAATATPAPSTTQAPATATATAKPKTTKAPKATKTPAPKKTKKPSITATPEYSVEPTAAVTEAPTEAPTKAPTEAPVPTKAPTKAPATEAPTATTATAGE